MNSDLVWIKRTTASVFLLQRLNVITARRIIIICFCWKSRTSSQRSVWLPTHEGFTEKKKTCTYVILHNLISLIKASLFTFLQRVFSAALFIFYNNFRRRTENMLHEFSLRCCTEKNFKNAQRHYSIERKFTVWRSPNSSFIIYL